VTHAQGEIPEPTGPAAADSMSASGDTTAVDGRIPAALLHELADELRQFEDPSEAETEGTRQPGED